MRIVMDKAIAWAPALFSPYGEIISAARITPQLARRADVLLVRSVTQVNEALLKEADRLHFVGSITAGTNHIDGAALHKRNIAWAAAPGSNASALTDYVLSALVIADIFKAIVRGRRTLGLVGGGHTAARLAGRINACGRLMGATPVIHCYDPLLRPEEFRSRRLRPVDFNQLLTSDCLSIHCPLTQGREGTHFMLDESALKKLKHDCLLINTARGEIIEPQALLEHARTGGGNRLIMDVWNNEPRPDPVLVQSCLIATPHIAGYGRLGKKRALDMVFAAFCRHQGIAAVEPKPSPHSIYLPPPPQQKEEPLDYISDLLLRNYDPGRDSLLTKRMLVPGRAGRAETFIRLRREYCLRREGCEWQVSSLPPLYRQATAAALMDSPHP